MNTPEPDFTPDWILTAARAAYEYMADMVDSIPTEDQLRMHHGMIASMIRRHQPKHGGLPNSRIADIICAEVLRCEGMDCGWRDVITGLLDEYIPPEPNAP